MKENLDVLLSLVKGYCTLLATAVTEASTPEVHTKLQNQLLSALAMQNAIYKQMESMGFYQPAMANPQELQKAKTTFCQK